MPRRKKIIEPEILLPEDDQPKRGQQVVEAKHTIEFKAPHIVPVEEPQEEEIDSTDDDIEIEDKPTRKPKDEHKKLRELLAQHNIAPTAQLRLSIERYLHSESSEGGTWSEKEFLTRYICTKEQIVNEDYLDVARKWGAGTYWFTLRMYTPGRSPGSRVVASWEKRLGPTTPVIQNVNPNDPNSPQVIIQSDGQPAVMPSIKDIMKVQREALKEQLEMAKLMREAYGFAPEQPQQQPRTEEEVLAGAILKQPEIIENVVGSVIKRFGGAGGKDDEPWYADVVRDMVKNGQAVQVIQVAIDRIFNGLSGLFPGGQDNGQAQMAQTPLQNQAQPQPGNEQSQFISGIQTQSQQIPASPNDGGAIGGVVGDVYQGSNTQMVALSAEQIQSMVMRPMFTLDDAFNLVAQGYVMPAQLALMKIIANCQRNLSPQGTCDWLVDFADIINDHIPDYSIDDYISEFAKMPVEATLELVKTQPNGEQVVALPHAKEWTAELQRLIKEARQEGEE